MVVAKPLGKNPREVAARWSTHFKDDRTSSRWRSPAPASSTSGSTGPIWFAVLRSIAAQGDDFGRSDVGKGERVNVEYVSANPTGPMHVGHTRGAVFGDALASLMAYSGYDVTREYYINDAGSQIDDAGPLNAAALPRGAGRDHRDPAGPLSRRLSRAGRRRRWQGRIW